MTPAGPPARPAHARRPAIEDLFHAEYARVVAVAARILQDRAEAEDIAQEVFLEYHRRRGAGTTAAPAWLHAAAAHAALNVARGRRRRARREERYAREPAAVSDPAHAVEVGETRREVRRALARLRPRAAMALALRHSGLSYAEVGEALGVRVTQVGTMLRRAEKALLREVGDASL